MDGIRLYGRYAAVSLKSQMQYPAGFLMSLVGQFATNILEFIGIWALFHRFGAVKGWTLGEVAVFFGVVSVGFALADMTSRGFETFGEEFVRTGAFDRILLRPRRAALQLLGQELRLTRLGRLAQGAVVLAIGLRLAGHGVSPEDVAILAFAVIGAVALFFGILVLQATLSFWTVESLEIVNTLTYGGVDAAQYPLDIYARWFRSFLTFVVPLACVVYFPVAAVLGHADRTGLSPLASALMPAFGLVFLAVSLLIWRLGVRHYASAGG
jgi:ABC-2 type transport system permease protein